MSKKTHGCGGTYVRHGNICLGCADCDYVAAAAKKSTSREAQADDRGDAGAGPAAPMGKGAPSNEAALGGGTRPEASPGPTRPKVQGFTIEGRSRVYVRVPSRMLKVEEAHKLARDINAVLEHMQAEQFDRTVEELIAAFPGPIDPERVRTFRERIRAILVRELPFSARGLGPEKAQ